MAALKLSLLALLASTSMLAQWPDYPTKGVPMKDGKPDLTGPAPRMPDGKVDFSGIWENGRGPGAAPAKPNPNAAGVKPGPNGPPPGPNGAPPPPPAKPDPNAAPAGPPAPTFGNIGQGFRDGLPLRPWAAELLKERKENNSKDNPDAHCLPMGFMQFHMHPQPRRMVQTKDMMYIIYEANYGLRNIFMDGRSLPPKDADEWWYGYSVGRWEDNDTLVVQTTRFRDLLWLDVNGTPLTTDAMVTERFKRPNFGRLEIEITIDDPKAYTAPFTVKFAQRISVNQEMIEFICGEGERDAPHLVGK